MFIIAWISFLLLIAQHICSSSKSYVTVETSNGKLVGKRTGKVVSYLGIPYAEPPVGKFRFRPSVPKRPWYPSELQAFNYSAECLQSALFAGESASSDEDCLYLNVWQPVKPKGVQPLPVMVWIYGGAFLHGSASRPEYSGHSLAARDVVVVSFNYRVGALGFLVSIPDSLFGNYGLHDQKLALQWVQDNIQLFGGDPNHVTVFGESAGAMSTVLHMLDQHNKPKLLFNAIILQSNPLGYRYRSLSVANFIGKAYKELLDCEDLRCLQAESPDELIHVQDTLMAVPRSIGDFFTWGPVITDSIYLRETRLRPGPVSNMSVAQPLVVMKELRKLNVPIIMGTNSHEGIVFVYTAWPRRMVKFLYQAIVLSFFRESAPQILKMYAPLSKKIDLVPLPDYRLVLSQIIGDYLFRCPNLLFSFQAAKLGNPVYLYEFALPTRTPGFECCNGLSCHTCELPFSFDHPDLITANYSWYGANFNQSSNDPSSAEYTNAVTNFLGMVSTMIMNGRDSDKKQLRHRIDTSVAKLMADYWSTFATYNNPNGLIDLNGVTSGTRPKNAPWWPRLFGELPSLTALSEMRLHADRLAKLVNSEKTPPDDFSDILDNMVSEFYRKLAWYDNFRLDSVDQNSDMDDMDNLEENTDSYQRTSISDYHEKYRNIHILKFDDVTGVKILENDDCICTHWDKLDYRF